MNPIESLERRVLMDGEVTVTFAGGDLTVTGDDGDNVVRISSPSAGTIRVSGMDDTEVNGEESVDFAGEIDDLRVNTRQGGEDDVDVQGPITVNGDVVAHLGEGTLAIEGTLGPVDIAGDLVVRPGGQGDVSIRNDVTVRGDARINTGGSASVVATPGLLPDFTAAAFGDPLDIDNPYMPLVPGTVYTFEERSIDEETGEESVERIVTEVTNDTRTILGVTVRVVHDREFVDGLLIEDTFDWFAQDDDGNVWYFGEDTTEFEYDDDGNLIGQSTAGSFEAGQGGARAGVVMLANPQAGDSYFQEVFVGEAIDRGKVLANDETLATDLLGTSTRVLRTEDTTALEAGALENKLYVPGFGMAQEVKLDPLTGEQDAVVNLVSATLNGQPVTQLVPPAGFNGTNPTGQMTGLVKFEGEMSVTSQGPLALTGVESGDDVLLYARADIVVRESAFNDELTILAPRSPGSVGLKGVSVADVLFLRASESVFVADSEFEQAFVHLGSGDDELVIDDSSFETLVADGGRGADTFEDEDNDFGELVLRRFESHE